MLYGHCIYMRLGERMKEYESVSRNYLMRRQPVIIRIDGRAFHTFTKGLGKPFDEILMEAMWETTKELCKEIEGCKIGYTQSDEISLLLTDYEKTTTCAWFDNNIQKMVSNSASIATLAFNVSFNNIYNKYLAEGRVSEDMQKIYDSKLFKAKFDSRAFSLPKDEVLNYFIWRQQDATRNSIQMVGRANFSHKELLGKSGNDIQELLFIKKNINFNDLPVPQKRGVSVIKINYVLENKEQSIRTKWIVDKNIPIFTQNGDYINKLIK